MKKRSILFLPLAWAIVALSCASGKGAGKSEVAAKVDEQTISTQEVIKVVHNFQKQNIGPDSTAQGATVPEKLYYTAVNRLVEQALILDEAKKLGIVVSDTEVTDNVNQLVSMAGGEAKLDSLLKAQGANRADVEKDMRNNLVLKGYLDHVKKTMPAVSDTAVQAFYSGHPELFGAKPEVHARHILIRATPQDSDMAKAEARQKAQAALDRAKKGEPFEKIAKEMSQDPGSASQGGDLGWFAQGQMVPTFDAVVFSLKPGQLSDVVQTDYGYHVIKLEGTRMGTGTPYDQVKEQIRDHLAQQETQEYFRKQLDSLKAKAKVKIESPSPAVLDSLQHA
jgi:parvulin-like peptidyl-prolyl isomerase